MARDESSATRRVGGVVVRAGQVRSGVFNCYCRFLQARTEFNWSNSPVHQGRIEQINLCRNDIWHDEDIDTTRPQQSAHFSKYPISIFADELELAAYGDTAEFPMGINVTRDKLSAASEDVQQF